jgi:purine-binding chemotaxis protein CheW
VSTSEPGRRSRLPRGSYRAEAQAAETIDYLGFRLETEEYALPLGFVHEILKIPTITEVPRAGPDILGIVSLRGTVVTVVDLRRRVGMKEQPFDRHSRVLVVNREREPMGLAVDAVIGVVRLTRAEIEDSPAVVGAQHGEFVAGVGRKDQSLYVLLDLSAVLQGI